jgi:cell division protein FtsN
MSPTECATESNPLVMAAEPSPAQPGVAGQTPAEKSRKRVFVIFTGTCVFGLALAGWYVGNRIYAADAVHSDAVLSPALEMPNNIRLPVPPPVGFVIPASAPKSPEFYLQTAALGDAQDLKFIKQLHTKGYAAKMDESSADGTDRILIGPYGDRAALERARRKLAGAGILAAESSR